LDFGTTSSLGSSGIICGGKVLGVVGSGALLLVPSSSSSESFGKTSFCLTDFFSGADFVVLADPFGERVLFNSIRCVSGGGDVGI